jgi:putative membrane protein
MSSASTAASSSAADVSSDRPDDSPELAVPSIRDHLANERTLLAWLRTAITVVGLGFIVDRLALGSSRGPEALAGIGLVLIGGALALAGAYSYLRARRELMTGRYQPVVGLHLVVVGVVVLGALVLAVYLLATARPTG